MGASGDETLRDETYFLSPAPMAGTGRMGQIHHDCRTISALNPSAHPLAHGNEARGRARQDRRT